MQMNFYATENTKQSKFTLSVMRRGGDSPKRSKGLTRGQSYFRIKFHAEHRCHVY